MSDLSYESIDVGYELPEHVVGPISRTTLAWFAGGSGDHNPIHIDIDFAKRYGSDDVFAHGMLSMAYLVQVVTQWVPQEQLREYGVRFVSITPVNGVITCNGKVTEKLEIDGEPCIKLELTAELEGGVKTLVGDAIIGFG